MPYDPAPPPVHALPPEFFAAWTPLTVNEFLRRQAPDARLSLALAALQWTYDEIDKESPAAGLLATAREDLTTAINCLAPENS